MTSPASTTDSGIRRRRIAVTAVAVVAAVAATLGVIRACSDEGVSHTFCGHMESVMGDVAGAQFAGLRTGSFPVLMLHLSPHMADTLDLLIEDAPSETSPLFEILHRNFDLGTLLLKRTMGYSDEKIEELRTFEISEMTALKDLVVPGTNAKSIESASDNLTDLLGSTYFERKAGETPRFRADGVDCGVFPEPDEDECSDLLVNETIADTYGFPLIEFATTATVTYDDGNCQWTINYEPSPENPEGDNAFLWVDVFSNTVANRVLTARLAEPGDVTTQPVIVDGARHSIGVYPCGRTAYVDYQGRSAVVAACGPRDLDDTTLTNLAIKAIESR
jgi:hypothetical protein